MNTFDPNQFSNNCAPIHSDDSIFFNLILNSNYENTKENCLLFLRNYSKQILYTKRDIFRIIINELTLGENANQDIRNDESIYLIHQIIKKYSRNNIINALYDFISVNEGENENENNLINKEKNTNNSSSTNDLSNDKSQNHERGQSINKNNKKRKDKDKKESVMKEKKNSIENSRDGGIFDNDNNNDINGSKYLKFLEKKRKSTSLKKTKKDKKAKKDKKEKKEIKENKEKEEKDDKNDKKSKKYEKKEKENNNEKEYEKEQNKEEEGGKDKEEEKENIINERELEKRDANESKEKLRMDNHEHTKKKKEKEKADIRKEIDDFEIEIERTSKVKEKKNIKKEENIFNEENESAKYQRRSYKNRTKNLCSKSPLKSFVSKSTRRIISPIEIIKLESGEDLINDSNITIFPMKSRKSKDKRRSANQLDILSYLNMSKSKDSNPLNDQEKQFGNHLIKDPEEKEFIYSYKIKKNQNIKKSNIILFECNNNKCQGKGEYDVERKIFRETVEHNIPPNFHNLAFAHYNMKQTLLMDDCLGYQLFKDSNTFIKDKKVIMLNNK